MKLERRIEQFLERTGMPAARLGRLALNDSRFVSDLRKGREVSESTATRVRAWLDLQVRGR